MTSVTSASRSITLASRDHPRYQSRSSMYIRGLIPRIFAELAEAVPIARHNSAYIFIHSISRLFFCKIFKGLLVYQKIRAWIAELPYSSILWALNYLGKDTLNLGQTP